MRNLVEIAKRKIKENVSDSLIKQHTNFDSIEDLAFNTMKQVEVTFTNRYENDEGDIVSDDYKGIIIDTMMEEIDDELERCFIVENETGKFLVPLFEISNQVKDFVKDNIFFFVNVNEYIENNLSQLKELENFEFLTNTQYGLEIEGGWNGNLREKMNGFARTTDNSFSFSNRDYNDEFVYRGCDTAVEMLRTLMENYPALESHDFIFRQTTGTHIHFSQTGDERGFNKMDFVKLVIFLAEIEDIIMDIVPEYRLPNVDRLNGEGRNNGGYSKSVHHHEDFLKTIKSIRYKLYDRRITEKNIDEVIDTLKKEWYGESYAHRGDKYNNTRYFGINLHSFFYRGSMELRHFEGNPKNVPYYVDVIDKIMYMIEEFEWDIIEELLTKLGRYQDQSARTCGLLYALGVSNKTLQKLLNRVDNYSRIFAVQNHPILNRVRERITNKELDIDSSKINPQENITDTTCIEEEIDEDKDYSDIKNSITDMIKKKKDNVEIDGSKVMFAYTGDDLDEFNNHLDRVSMSISDRE